MKHEDFLKAAQKRYGSKVAATPITNCTFRAARYLGLKRRDLLEYPPQVWIVLTSERGYLCPECSAELGGLFGSFTWGLAHGQGYCRQCNKTTFQLYHYIEKNNRKGRLQQWSLTSFPK